MINFDSEGSKIYFLERNCERPLKYSSLITPINDITKNK